jgi:hypothetical protein
VSRHRGYELADCMIYARITEVRDNGFATDGSAAFFMVRAVFRGRVLELDSYCEFWANAGEVKEQEH